MNTSVEAKFLKQLCENKTEVAIHTIDGRKTTCIIDEVDDFAILVRVCKGNKTPESHLFYKHAISSINLC